MTGSLVRTRPYPAGFTVLLMVLLMAVLIASGCAPRGQHHGRMDPSETARDERRSSRLLPVAITEFSDSAAEQLITNLPDVRHIRESDERVIVILGDLNNQTRNVSTNDFEVLQRRLRSNLLNSEVTERIAFREHRSRMTGLAERERIASEGVSANPEDYDPDKTFALNGNFYRISRGDVNYYYLEFDLVHVATNDIVWNARTDEKQLRQRR